MNVGLPPSGLGLHPELLIDGVTPANETSLDTSSVREHSQVGDAKNWCYFTRVLKVLFYAFYCFAIYNASYIYIYIYTHMLLKTTSERMLFCSYSKNKIQSDYTLTNGTFTRGVRVNASHLL